MEFLCVHVSTRWSNLNLARHLLKKKGNYLHLCWGKSNYPTEIVLKVETEEGTEAEAEANPEIADASAIDPGLDHPAIHIERGGSVMTPEQDTITIVEFNLLTIYLYLLTF